MKPIQTTEPEGVRYYELPEIIDNTGEVPTERAVGGEYLRNGIVCSTTFPSPRKRVIQYSYPEQHAGLIKVALKWAEATFSQVKQLEDMLTSPILSPISPEISQLLKDINKYKTRHFPEGNVFKW